MFRNLTNIRKAVIFYVITITLTTAVAMLAPVIGDAVLLVAMLAPVLAVLIMLLVVTRDGYTRAGWADLGLHRTGRQAWAFAILMPLPVLLFSYGVVWVTGIARLAVPSSTGSVIGGIPHFLIGLIISLFFTLGEEVGWRGYLLPRLLTLGTRPAVLLTGLLHGIFHLPLILLTPFYHGEGNRLIIVPLFLLTLTLAGVVFGYLRLTTNSTWPPTLMHLAWNNYWEILNSLTVAVSPVALEYLAGESGLLTIIALAVVAGWLLPRLPGQMRAAVQAA